MNLIEIAGHLGADPEERMTPNGNKVVSLRMATHSRRGGNDETIWYRVTIWGDRFDRMIPYLKKGSPLIVVGELHRPEIYTDKQGNPQVTLEVTAEILRFSPFGRGDREETNGVASPGAKAQSFAVNGVAASHATAGAPDDDDLPF